MYLEDDNDQSFGVCATHLPSKGFFKVSSRIVTFSTQNQFKEQFSCSVREKMREFLHGICGQLRVLSF